MFGRRKAAEPDPSRRQRLQNDRQAPVNTYSYHSRRAPLAEVAVTSSGAGDSSALKRAGSFLSSQFGLAILLLTAIACLVSVVRLSSSPRIVVLGQREATALRALPTYEAAAQEYLRGSLLNGNKVTADVSGLTQDLQRRFPELTLVSVTLPVFANRPVVYVRPAQPMIVLDSSSGRFVIDSTGRAVATPDAVPATAIKGLATVADQSGIPLQSGAQALTAADVAFIRLVVDELAASEVGISAISLPPASRQLDVKIAGKPYYVKFNLQASSARQQVGTYLALRNALTKDGVTPKDYIDVRVDGRAYYR